MKIINYTFNMLSLTRGLEFVLSLSSLLWRPTQLYLMGEGRGEGAKKVALLFQFTIHIHRVKTLNYYSSLQFTYTFKTLNYYSSLQFTYTFKTLKQTAKARTLYVCTG